MNQIYDLELSSIAPLPPWPPRNILVNHNGYEIAANLAYSSVWGWQSWVPIKVIFQKESTTRSPVHNYSSLTT